MSIPLHQHIPDTHWYLRRDPRALAHDFDDQPLPVWGSHVLVDQGSPYSIVRRINLHRRADIESRSSFETTERIRRFWLNIKNADAFEALGNYEDDQWNYGYLNTFFAHDDERLDHFFRQDFPFCPPDLGFTWHLTKPITEIDATATKLQRLCPPSTLPGSNCFKPRFSEIPEAHKAREVRRIADKLSVLVSNPQYPTHERSHEGIVRTLASDFLHEHRLYTFVPAITCKYRAIAAARYEGFYSIDELRQKLITLYHEVHHVPTPIPTLRGSWLGDTSNSPEVPVVPSDEELAIKYAQHWRTLQAIREEHETEQHSNQIHFVEAGNPQSDGEQSDNEHDSLFDESEESS